VNSLKMVVKISEKKTKKKERRRISFFLLSFLVGVLCCVFGEWFCGEFYIKCE
jgi:uncharacterized membrane protein YoaK (UPF0700 family)